jgi:hypothetical protein
MKTMPKKLTKIAYSLKRNLCFILIYPFNVLKLVAIKMKVSLNHEVT